MNLKVSVKNTYSYISKDFNILPRDVQNRLVKKLSYERKINLNNTEEVYLLTKNPNSNGDLLKYYQIPTGLLYKFYHITKKEGVRLALRDERGPKPGTRSIELFFKRLNKVCPKIERRDYQENAINKCLKFGRGLIEHSTGAGKSLIIAGIAYCTNVKTLVLCIGKEHIRQLSRDLEQMVGGTVSVYGGPDKDTSGHIVIATIQSLNSLKKKNFDKFTKLMKQFKCVMADESHHAASMSYRQCLYFATNAYWKFGFSGTMHREDGAFIEVEGAIGPILDKKDYTYLEEGNYIVPVKFYFIDPMCKPLYGLEANSWPYCSVVGIVENYKRNKKIADVCKIYQKKGKQVLVISPFRIEHGGTLTEMISDSKFLFGNSSDYTRDQTLKDFANKEFSVLIASRIFDEVINLPDVRCVVLAGGGKAHNAFFQRVGRGIRKATGKAHVDVVLFWDSHGKILLRHSKRLKYYITKIDAWKNNVKMIGQYRKQYHD